MTNGADTNCRTAEQVMNGQRLVSGQGIVRPTNTEPCDHDW